MTQETWNDLRLPAGGDYAWDLFHENSKTGRYDYMPPDDVVRARMGELLESLTFDQYPSVELPASLAPLKLRLEEAISTRVTARNVEPCPLSLETVATILHYAYGVTRDNEDSAFPRPFRTVPSGGALYPLEIFFHSAHVEELQAGLYHYNPARKELRFLRYGDESNSISAGLVQKNLAVDTSLILFITAIFERSVFKYGDRGYRFVLLEAGHVAQNVNLVANALGLASVNIGGFFDRQIDDLLGLDGVTHSTIYMVGIGKEGEQARGAEAIL